TSYSLGGATVRDLSVQQANLGTAGSLAVSVDVTTAATQGTLTATVPVGAAAIASSVVVTLNDTSTITVTGTPAGAALNGVAVNIVNDAAITAGSASAVYDDAGNAINVHVNGNTAKATIAAAITALADFNAAAGGGG